MRGVFLATATILALVLGACAAPAGQTGAAPAGGAKEIKVTASEFKFSPSAVDVPAGVPIKLELKNIGTVEHDFVVDALKVKVQAGAAKTVSQTIGPLAAGTYDVYCAVPGHKEAGMIGKVVVR